MICRFRRRSHPFIVRRLLLLATFRCSSHTSERTTTTTTSRWRRHLRLHRARRRRYWGCSSMRYKKPRVPVDGVGRWVVDDHTAEQPCTANTSKRRREGLTCHSHGRMDSYWTNIRCGPCWMRRRQETQHHPPPLQARSIKRI